MNRRNFIKTVSLASAFAIGEFSGMSKVFGNPQTNQSILLNSSVKDMENRSLGILNVSAIGLGCLPIVGYYGGKFEKKIQQIGRATLHDYNLANKSGIQGCVLLMNINKLSSKIRN